MCVEAGYRGVVKVSRRIGNSAQGMRNRPQRSHTHNFHFSHNSSSPSVPSISVLQTAKPESARYGIQLTFPERSESESESLQT